MEVEKKEVESLIKQTLSVRESHLAECMKPYFEQLSKEQLDVLWKNQDLVDFTEKEIELLRATFRQKLGLNRATPNWSAVRVRHQEPVDWWSAPRED